MKKVMLQIAALTGAVIMLSSCASGLAPVTGFIYSDVKGPFAVTGNAGANKVGTAEAKSILGWIGTGDASIEAASKAAGITRIHHVDYHTKSILGIVATTTVIVYGE